MATGIEANILAALLSHLSGLTLTPAMSLAWPDIDFEPPAQGYLRATLVPNTVEQVTLGTNGKNRHRGLFQVDVFWKRNAGEIVPREKADLVAAQFKRGTVLTSGGLNIRINRPPRVAQTLESGPYTQTPVLISYQVDADNPS